MKLLPHKTADFNNRAAEQGDEAQLSVQAILRADMISTGAMDGDLLIFKLRPGCAQNNHFECRES